MTSYKCNGCGHQWSSEEEPFNCPECNSTDFEVVESKAKLPLKKIGIGVGILVLIILLLKICGGGGNKVSVAATQDNSNATLSVVLGDYEPYKAKDFKITLKKDGVVQDEKKSVKTTFSDLEGTYTLEVKYIGKDGNVEIGEYKRSYTFPEQPKAITILSVSSDRQFLPKPTDTYTITVSVDDDANAEYQLDGGDWQKSNKFEGLKGKNEDYVIVVRNGLAPNNTSLQDQKTKHLNPYKKAEPLTKAQIEALLRKVADHNDYDASDKAYDELLSKVGASTPVVGASNISTLQQLANAVNNGTNYTVTSVEYDSDKSYIVKIRVQ